MAGQLLCLEGIDGSGKSTVAPLLARELQARGLNAVHLDRSAVEECDGYFAAHLTALRRLIWEYPRSASIQTLGDRHWLHLLSAWFHAYAEQCLIPRLAGGSIVILDGWAFKYAARFSLKPGLNDRAVTRWFQGLPTPNQVYLLTLAPSHAAARIGEAKPSETGRLDGYGASELDAFCAYQVAVQEKLLGMGQAAGWREVPVGQLTPSQVSAWIADDFASTATLCAGAAARPLLRHGG